jgi:hypothetical protein
VVDIDELIVELFAEKAKRLLAFLADGKMTACPI